VDGSDVNRKLIGVRLLLTSSRLEQEYTDLIGYSRRTPEAVTTDVAEFEQALRPGPEGNVMPPPEPLEQCLAFLIPSLTG
jgi:hypothetical protein